MNLLNVYICVSFVTVLKTQQVNQISSFTLSVEVTKEERPEIQKKTYKWNTKEEAKQAFKELLKEKVRQMSSEVNLLMTYTRGWAASVEK